MSCKVQQSVCPDCVTYEKSRIDFNNFNTFNNVKMQELRPKKEDAQIKSIIGIPSPEQTMSSCVVPLDEELYFALKKHSANNGKIPLRTMCYNIIRDYAIKEKLIQE